MVGNSQESQKGTIKFSLSGIPVIDWNNGFSGFVIKPGFEYFVSNKLSIHNDFFFHFQSINDEGGVEMKSKTFGFVPISSV